VRFTKGHGTGNDFVVVPDPDGDLDLSPALVAALCDRRTGIGADGVLRVVLTAVVPEFAHLAPDARWFMDYRNADGSLAQMCGNGARVYGRYLVDNGYQGAGPMALATRSGVRLLDVPAEGDIRVDMGPARLVEGTRKVSLDGRSWTGTEVWVGNPHVVVAESDLAGLGEVLTPPVLEPSMPANVEFVHVVRPGRMAMRVHERGSGETASCGTGACAAAVAEAVWRGESGTDALVDVPGGRLRVSWADGIVTLLGPAEIVAHGVLDDRWLEAR
jgi:diaminopimelate epimerase